MELQKQLIDIDSRLNDLELRGRHLEDSIRKGQYSYQIYNSQNSLLYHLFKWRLIPVT